MSETSLSISQLCHTLAPQKCLQIPLLTLANESRVALLGLNGAGKSSLIRLLVGESLPQQGRIEYPTSPQDGETLVPNSRDFKRCLGYQADTMLAIAEMTAFQYLSLAATLKGLSAKQVKQSIDRVTQQWQLSELLNKKMSQLSKGNLQKLAIAQAFIGEFKYLIFDEPCQSLDPMEQERFNQNISQLEKFELCLFSTHNVQQALAVADQIILIDQYKVLFHFDFKRPLSFLLVLENAISESASEFLQSVNKSAEDTALNLLSTKVTSSILHICFDNQQQLDCFEQSLNHELSGYHFFLPERQAVLPLFRLLASGEIKQDMNEELSGAEKKSSFEAEFE